MNCITCDLVTSFEEAALTAATSIYSAIAPPMAAILSSVVGIVFLWRVYQATVVGVDLGEEWEYIWKLILGLFVVSWLLSDPGVYLTYIYYPTSQMIYGMAGLVAAGGGAGGAGGTLGTSAGLAVQVEENLGKALNLAAQILDQGRFRPDFWVAGLGLLIPFFILTAVFALILMWCVLLLIVPFALGPVFLVAAMFGPSRSMVAKGAIVISLSSFFTLAIGSLMIGLTSSMIGVYIERIDSRIGNNADDDGGWFFAPDVTGVLWSFDFVGLLLLAWISVLFMYRAEHLAGMIVGSTGFGSFKVKMPSIPSSAPKSSPEPSAPSKPSPS